MHDPAIAVLRRSAELLSAIPDPAAQSLAAALRRYEAEGPFGVTLEQAVGVARAPGTLPWWEVEKAERRAAALRAIRDTSFAHIGNTKAAREIASKGRRYETRTIRTTLDPLYEVVVQSGGFPQWRRIYDILCS